MKTLLKPSSIKRVVCVVKRGTFERFSLGGFLGNFGDLLGGFFFLDLLGERLFGKSFWGLFEWIFGKDFM